MTKAFISYSHQDEQYCKELEKHLSILKRNELISTWTDRKIIPGEEWDKVISNELQEAKIILLLISPDFLNSDYCYEVEMKSAILRHDKNEAKVIPIFLRFCDWKNTPFSKIQGLATDGKPVKDWQDTDKAFLNIVEGIKNALNILTNISNTKDGITFGLSFSGQLSDVRKRIILASNERELRKLLFELEELKKVYPRDFELEELKRQILAAIEFYMHSIPKAAQSANGTVDKYSSSGCLGPSLGGCLIYILAALISIILIYLFYFFK